MIASAQTADDRKREIQIIVALLAEADLALNVRASSRDERLVAQAGRILDEITGRAKGGR